MAQQVILEINDKNEIVRLNRNRATALARLDLPNKTLYWKDQDSQTAFHKSVEGFLEAEKLVIRTTLLEGMTPDELPKNAPAVPDMHFLQGDCTPKYVEYMLAWEPKKATVLYGIELRALAEGEREPEDIRERWVRADVVRTDSRPIEETRGGEYLATRFKMKDQIIARRKTHMTFERKEIWKGDKPIDQAIPYDDPYTPKKLDALEKQGKIEVVYRRHSAASAGASF